MKSKFSVHGINVCIFAAAALIALPLRTYQYFNVSIIEEELRNGATNMGFLPSGHWSTIILFGVLVIASAAICALAFTQKKTTGYDLAKGKRPGFAAACAIGAVGFGYDAVSYFSNIKNNEILSETATSNKEFSEIIIAAQAILAVISAIYFLVLSFGNFSGSVTGKEFKFISLAPPLWCAARLVYRFIRTVNFIKVSDILFEMVMLIFFVQFFVAFAQINSNVNAKNMEWRLSGFGLPGALFALLCFVPRIIAVFGGKADALYAFSTYEFCDLATAVVIVATILTRLGKTSCAEKES